MARAANCADSNTVHIPLGLVVGDSINDIFGKCDRVVCPFDFNVVDCDLSTCPLRGSPI